MKGIASFFVRRPVASALLAVAIVLAGLLAWRLLPVAPLPAVDFPVINVRANLPGASPESMASTVAAPLERALGNIAGLTRIQSGSNQGATEIMLEFDLDRDINEAARDVQAALNAVRSQLPASMTSDPSYVKMNPSQAPMMALALSAPDLPPSVLYDNASTVLAQKLAQLAGVGEVRVDGSSLPAVRVQLNPAALTQMGVSMETVRAAIADANAWRPLGTVEQGRQRWQIALADPLRTAQAFSAVVIRRSGDTLVRLGDVAQVTDSVENRYTSGYHNDQPAVILLVSRRANANIVQTIDAIHAQLPQLRALLPAGASLKVVMDRSPGIRATLAEAQFTLLASCLLVIAVVWLFLGNLRSALIPAVALPVALIGTFAVMWWQGFLLNNLSLMALIVAAGLVVDDAIVVLENVQRHIEKIPAHVQVGRSAIWRAALRGAGEVGFTLMAMNAALIVVFLSILFMGGVLERLFREFSITLVAAMVISLVVSVTLTPALCAHFLPLRKRRLATLPVSAATVSSTEGAVSGRLLTSLCGHAARQTKRMLERAHVAFTHVRCGYGRSLQWALRHVVLILLLLAGVIVLNVWLYLSIPKGMLPQQDTGQLSGFVRGDDGFSFQVMQPKIEAYRKQLMADPAVADVTGASGGRGGISNSYFRVRLAPLAERRESAASVAARLRRQAPPTPGGMLIVNVDQDIRLSSQGGEGEYLFALRSDSLEALRIWTAPVGAALRALPELVDVYVPGGEDAQQVVLEIDRVAAQRLGIAMEDVGASLNNSFSQRQVATLYDPLNQYRVVMEMDPAQGADPSALEHLQLVTANGARVPLASFATWRYGLTRDRVFHEGQFAAVGIEYGLAPGVSLQQAQDAIDRAVSSLMMPSNLYTGPLADDVGSLQDTLRRQPLLILGVLVAIYLVLGILYESTLHPLTILSTLPSAGVGALFALRVSGTEFSLIALLGLFLLIGVVMKNAILMIDFALIAQRRHGQSPHEAISGAARARLRPILMTNLAGLLAAIPLIMGLGEGSEMRRPLGIAIIGGLAVSQILTLYTTPVIYLCLEKLRARFARSTYCPPQ